MVPIGARLAEMARVRLKYDESRRQVGGIQQSLAALEERISPGSLESDKDRLLLIQEKEQLLRELRSITPRSRTEAEMAAVREEIGKLEMDLSNAFEHSNRYHLMPTVLHRLSIFCSEFESSKSPFFWKMMNHREIMMGPKKLRPIFMNSSIPCF